MKKCGAKKVTIKTKALKSMPKPKKVTIKTKALKSMPKPKELTPTSYKVREPVAVTGVRG